MNDTVTDPVAILTASSLFAEFSHSDIELVRQYLDVRNGNQGDLLFLEGEPADAMYIVVSGKVELLLNDAEGNQRLIGWMGPLENFGGLSLICKSARQLSVRAAGPVGLLELHIESFARMRERAPALCLRVILAIVRDLGVVMDANHAIVKRLLLQQLSLL